MSSHAEDPLLRKRVAQLFERYDRKLGTEAEEGKPRSAGSCSFFSNSVDEADAFDEFGDSLTAVEAAPPLFAFPPELENEGERSKPAAAAFGLIGAVPDRGKT